LLDTTWPAVRGRRVVDHDHRQPIEPQPPRELNRLEVAALLELGVADQAEDARPAVPLRVERERDADRDRQSVAERSARDLDTRNEDTIRVVAER